MDLCNRSSYPAWGLNELTPDHARRNLFYASVSLGGIDCPCRQSGYPARETYGPSNSGADGIPRIDRFFTLLGSHFAFGQTGASVIIHTIVNHGVLAQVQCHTVYTAGKFDHSRNSHIRQGVFEDAHDPVERCDGLRLIA